jgi:hypothetical protein
MQSNSPAVNPSNLLWFAFVILVELWMRQVQCPPPSVAVGPSHPRSACFLPVFGWCRSPRMRWRGVPQGCFIFRGRARLPPGQSASGENGSTIERSA